MASHTTALPSPSPTQVAKAIAGAVPSDLSKSPLIGILGVVLGAGIVTLTGRMLTLGTADLKGSLGIGVDDGAWIGSAFNVALMFIGPFTVYLGGLLGARRVLMIAASLFTLLCALLPLVHSYSLLITSAGPGRLNVRNVLSADPNFRLEKYSLAISSFHPGALCHVCRRRRKHCAIALWLVSRPSLLSLDVLELRCCSPRSWWFVSTVAFPPRLPPNEKGPRPVLPVSYMPALASLCCLPRSIRASAWTGGVPDFSTP